LLAPIKLKLYENTIRTY